MHRLWHCSRNARRRKAMEDSLDFRGNLLDTIPACMARAAAIPADFTALGAEDICKVLDYLAWAAADGTYCFANAIRGEPIPAEHINKQDEKDASFARIYGSLAPMARPKCDRPVRSAPALLQTTTDDTCIRIYTDGSYTAAAGEDDEHPARSGWGICCVIPAHTANDGDDDAESFRIMSFCGPTVLHANAPRWHGAWKHSNNIAELQGIIAACQFILLRCTPGARVQICYDSKYAAMMATQRWRPGANIKLIRTALALVAEVRKRNVLTWAWVKGHADDQFNQRADELAAVGANGEQTLWDDVDIVSPSPASPPIRTGAYAAAPPPSLPSSGAHDCPVLWDVLFFFLVLFLLHCVCAFGGRIGGL